MDLIAKHVQIASIAGNTIFSLLSIEIILFDRRAYLTHTHPQKKCNISHFTGVFIDLYWPSCVDFAVATQRAPPLAGFMFHSPPLRDSLYFPPNLCLNYRSTTGKALVSRVTAESPDKWHLVFSKWCTRLHTCT